MVGGADPRRSPAVAISLRLDVQFTKDASVFVILLANKSAKIRTATHGRIESLNDKLRLDLRYLHCRGEPAGQLGDRLLRRLRRRDYPDPEVHLIVLVARLGDSRYVRQWL